MNDDDDDNWFRGFCNSLFNLICNEFSRNCLVLLKTMMVELLNLNLLLRNWKNQWSYSYALNCLKYDLLKLLSWEEND